MKRSAGSQRITLFPFLAVLICTMGSLLVLLVVISKRAQATAELSIQQSDDAELKEISRQHEELSSDLAKMHGMRRQITDYLAERRRALAHIEDHMRRLGEEIRRLQTQAKQNDLHALKKEGDHFSGKKRRCTSIPKATQYYQVHYIYCIYPGLFSERKTLEPHFKY